MENAGTVRRPAGESAAHRELKRLALIWAHAQGYRMAAAEVSIPRCGFRLDVAAYRATTRATVGSTALFECKQSRADFLHHGRPLDETLARLEALHARKRMHDEALKTHFPSLRNGDSLFPEFESYRFEAAGYEVYDRLLQKIQRLSNHLHRNTKFEKLTRWQAANLHYLVAEPGILRPHEIPCGWGLLLREGEELRLAVKPAWRELSEPLRIHLLERIAMAATRAVHQKHAIPRIPF